MSDKLTAVLIARNAERTISQCLKALAFCDHVIVGENESSDQTAQLAQAAGAEVRSVNWEGYGKTKNRLIVGQRNKYVLHAGLKSAVMLLAHSAIPSPARFP